MLIGAISMCRYFWKFHFINCQLQPFTTNLPAWLEVVHSNNGSSKWMLPSTTAHCEKNVGLGCAEISKVCQKYNWQKCFKNNADIMCKYNRYII